MRLPATMNFNKIFFPISCLLICMETTTCGVDRKSGIQSNGLRPRGRIEGSSIRNRTKRNLQTRLLFAFMRTEKPRLWRHATHMDTDEGVNKGFKRLHTRRTPTTGGNDFGCGLATSRSTEKTGSLRSLRGKSRGYTDTGRLTEKLESGTGERPSRSTEKSGSPKPSIRRTSLQGNPGVEEPGAVRLTEKAGRVPIPRAGNPPNTSPPGQNALGRPLGAGSKGSPMGNPIGAGPEDLDPTRAGNPPYTPPPGQNALGRPLGAGSESSPVRETPRGRLREQPCAGDPTGHAQRVATWGTLLQREEQDSRKETKRKQGM